MSKKSISLNFRLLLTYVLISIGAGGLAKASDNFDVEQDARAKNFIRLKLADTLKVNTAIPGINTAKAGRITLEFKYDSSLKKAQPVSKKLIVVNGKVIDHGSIGGVEEADYFLMLDGEEGIKKYGAKSESGVIEAVGRNIKMIAIPSPPPAGLPPAEY
ncbi:MAG: hypothetical protein EOO20_05155 [Chryseobacterium sp.]|nr:MAG: hypothetical protein EOO20_05155 [Chryseobacterium sp.]